MPCTQCAYTPNSRAANLLAVVHAHGSHLAKGHIYSTNRLPVSLVCPQGHTTVAPWPVHITRGRRSVCPTCSSNPQPFDRVYLLVHPEAAAIKIGRATGPNRVCQHLAHGYYLAAHWTGLDNQTAIDTETAVKRMWKDADWPKAVGVHQDGHTETTDLDKIGPTQEFVISLLGVQSPLPTASTHSVGTLQGV
jgi:hypothetical protein